MDSICQNELTGLPGESILIGDAARTNVPALLDELIPRMGNYGAIQSAATSLAAEHNLDMAASLWVVREFARALGYIAAGTATGTSPSFPGGGTAEAEREGSRGTGTGGGEAGSALAAGAAGIAAGAAGAGVAAGTSEAGGAGVATGPGGAAGAGACGAGAGG